MVLEKSWNMRKWPKVTEFYPFCPQIVLNLYFSVITMKLSSDLESPHFPTFSAKRCEFKIGERNGHGKSRYGHGKVMENIVESVGTLSNSKDFYGNFPNAPVCRLI